MNINIRPESRFVQNFTYACQLTDWEKKYLTLYAKGYCVETICIMLNTSSSTLYRKRSGILQKTKFSTIKELIASIKSDRRDENMNQILSTREREVFEVLRLGKSNKEIAEILYISIGTVESHISNIYNKLSLRNKIDLFNRC
ncbi:response regulator transcription factor [Persicobacter diffluens]|uniref:HTH luxR-type domain-containing protein n=1 Tax=Persicobacter diffluens TaxID=981 RepID=A0AAN4W547_9BACT|nr:hypothetical protein PEDI_53830 [Persicobacter diffluens]